VPDDPREREALQHEAHERDDEGDEDEDGALVDRTGIVWDAARVTTPRMPAQTMTVPWRHPSGDEW
jgi:hypothetical protein